MAVTEVPHNHIPKRSKSTTHTSQRLFGDSWQNRYAKRLVITDIAVVLASVFAAHVLRYGFDSATLNIANGAEFGFELNYVWFSTVLALAWMFALALGGTRDYRITGTGTAEYRAVSTVTLQVFGAVAILAYLFKTQLGRGYFLLALPIGLLALLLTRWLWRKWLLKQRATGEFMHRAAIVGDYQKNTHVIKQILSEPNAGYEIIGAFSDVNDPAVEQMMRDAYPFPWITDTSDLVRSLDSMKVDAVIYTSSDTFSPDRLRRLGWRLEERGIEFIVAPALTDIAGPRIHTRPVAGLPLIHVEYPEFSGQKYWFKRLFDIAATSVLIVCASPLLLAVAVAVKLDSKGPVIFRQERVGMNGESFKMLKFRSMVVDAEEKLQELLEQTDGNGVLFKMKSDPRVTRTGGFLRKYSIDELPQLFNVLKGDMSLVGPRPPLAREVELYDEWAGRRLLVKPGITGLWQVSGRSDLSWDDSIRLDQYYVENWSLIGDIQLLYRTIRTVISPAGAY